MIRRASFHFHRWAPAVLLAVFAFGILSFWFSTGVHGQVPTAESDAVSIAYLQRRVEDLADVPAQLSAVRERLVRVEADSAAHGKKLDDIADLGKWLVLGVFGSLGVQILRAFRYLPEAPRRKRERSADDDSRDQGMSAGA